jgi:hypothetical protein
VLRTHKTPHFPHLIEMILLLFYLKVDPLCYPLGLTV